MASPKSNRPNRVVESRPEEAKIPPVIFKEDLSEEGQIKKKIIKGRVIKRKKSFGQRLMETFFGDTMGSVGDYIVHDVLIPAAKSLVSDVVTGGIDMALFSEKRSSRTKRDRGSSIVSYSSYYKDRDRGRDDRDERRPGKKIDDLVFERRIEATEILDVMGEHLEQYEQISIADLFDYMGVISKDHTDHDYGWTNLSRARVDSVRGGFLLNLPRAVELE